MTQSEPGGRFAGKVALVTGAARAQGRSHAVGLAAEGADVIVLDVCRQLDVGYPMPDRAMLAETADQVRAQGRRVVECEADVRDQASIDAAVAAGLQQLGRLDVVVANAGIFTAGTVAALSDQQWRDVIDVNLSGVWRTVKAAAPAMIAQGEGGSIVLISSSAGLKGYTGSAHYVAAKHGVIGLMRTSALELAPHLIRVNAVCPTTVATPMALQDIGLRRRFRPDLEQPTIEDLIPPSKELHVFPIPWIDCQDVTDAVTWLACDEARYVTGIALPVDAGTLVK